MRGEAEKSQKRLKSSQLKSLKVNKTRVRKKTENKTGALAHQETITKLFPHKGRFKAWIEEMAQSFTVA